MQASLDVLDRADQAAVVMDPVRKRLLERFREPRSAAEAARELGLPRQRVGHHVRLLRRKGLLRRVGERRKGNFVEQVLQTSARAYVIDPRVLGELGADPEEIRDRFSSAYLLAGAARTIREVSRLESLARESGKRLPTLSLETEVRFPSAARQSAFAKELAARLAELVEKYHDETAPRGRRFRFAVSGHPALPRRSDDPSRPGSASPEDPDDANRP